MLAPTWSSSTALMATHTGNGALQTSCHWLVYKWETQVKPQLFGEQFYLAFIVFTESVLCDIKKGLLIFHC